MLVDAGADIQARNNETGWVPLHDAANYGNLDVVKKLLSLNAPHMARTSFGELPIDFAREAGHEQIVDFLENYIPSAATTKLNLWLHGTLDRSEASLKLRQFAKKMHERHRKTEQLTDDDKANANEDEASDEVTGIFLVRYSKKENSNVLTLLDNDNLRNFIIREYVSRSFLVSI